MENDSYDYEYMQYTDDYEDCGCCSCCGCTCWQYEVEDED